MTITEEIGSIRARLANTVDEKEQAEIILEILKKYSSINSTEGRPFIDQLLLLAEKLNNELFKAWGLFYLAVLKRLVGEHDLSIDLCQEAFPLFKRLRERKGTADTYNNIGIIYKEQGNFAEARKNLLAGLRIREEMGDHHAIAASFNNLGNVYFRQNFYREALNNHLAALKLREQSGDKSGIGYSYNNIGNVYFEQGNYPEALKSYTEALKLREEIEDKSGIADSLGNIGSVYSEQENYPEALKNHFASLKLHIEMGHGWGIAACYSNIGNVYFNRSNFDEARKYHLLSLKLSEETGSKDLTRKSALALTNICKATADFENAIKYYEIYHKAESELMGLQTEKQLSNLNFKHKIDQAKKQLEIDRLKIVELQKEKLSAELSIKQLQMNPHDISSLITSAISYMNDKGESDGTRYLYAVNELVRLKLEYSKCKLIKLSDEIKSIELLLHLKKPAIPQLQWEIIFDSADEIEREFIWLPPGLIYPFVENAIIHGIAPMTDRTNAIVKVRMHQKSNLLFVEVSDNGTGYRDGQPLDSVTEKKRFAFANTKERIGAFNKERNIYDSAFQIRNMSPELIDKGTSLSYQLAFIENYQV